MKSIQMLANLRDHATNRTDRLTPGTVSVVLSAMMLVLIMLGTPASAQTFSVLYNFGTNNGDPTDPANGTVTQGQDGNLYGASWNGGINICGDAGVTCGSVFRITPDGALSVIYNFSGADGEKPIGLTLGIDGNFYGATAYGINGHSSIARMPGNHCSRWLVKLDPGRDGGAYSIPSCSHPINALTPSWIPARLASPSGLLDDAASREPPLLATLPSRLLPFMALQTIE
jgi:uncharacterized repeat protein (TIGR03803 family)